MNNEQQQLDFLDVITVASFIIQMQNQSKIFSLHDIQEDNARITEIIQQHLAEQDKK